MPKFLIERTIPGAGKSTPAQLREGAKNSNAVVRELGPEIKWLHSYITDDKVYCVFAAPSEEIIIEHARCLGVPADRVAKITAVTDPGTE